MRALYSMFRGLQYATVANPVPISVVFLDRHTPLNIKIAAPRRTSHKVMWIEQVPLRSAGDHIFKHQTLIYGMCKEHKSWIWKQRFLATWNFKKWCQLMWDDSEMPLVCQRASYHHLSQTESDRIIELGVSLQHITTCLGQDVSTV